MFSLANKKCLGGSFFSGHTVDTTADRVRQFRATECHFLLRRCRRVLDLQMQIIYCRAPELQSEESFLSRVSKLTARYRHMAFLPVSQSNCRKDCTTVKIVHVWISL